MSEYQEKHDIKFIAKYCYKIDLNQWPMGQFNQVLSALSLKIVVLVNKDRLELFQYFSVRWLGVFEVAIQETYVVN